MANAYNGYFVWHDLITKDPKAAIAFYTEVAGWKTQLFGQNDYVMWVGPQGPLGGVVKLTDEMTKMNAPSHWMGHVQVENVDTAAATARRLGGKIYEQPTDLPNVGRFAVMGDLQGLPIGAFKPLSSAPPHDDTKEGEFCWNELFANDSVASLKFYSELFGWNVIQETDVGPNRTYRIYGVGTKQLGGMITNPPGNPMPPLWFHYIETSDIDSALSRATKRGAKILNGPMLVPSGGKIAQLADPQGACFAFHQLANK